MNKKNICLSTAIFILTLLFCSNLLAQSPSQESGEEADAQEENQTSLPQWVKRTSYGVNIETGQKARMYLETVQPLYQSGDENHTVFTHDRLSFQSGRNTVNLGLGYRRLLFDEALLAGVNTFFDYQDLRRHFRQGLGFEVFTGLLEARVNTYFGLSPKRKVEESASLITYEKAANGFDAELGGPVPYLPWLKLFGAYYWYDFRKFDNVRGWKTRGEIKLLKAMTVNVESFDDNKGSREWRGDIRMSFAFDTLRLSDFFSALRLPAQAYPKTSLKKRVLDRVERNFNIQLEKWSETKTGGFVLEVRRDG